MNTSVDWLLIELKKLQKAFARIDNAQKRLAAKKKNRALKLVQRLNHIKLHIYKETNHQLPHFHIIFKKQYSASYEITTCEQITGHMPKKYENKMLQWAENNKNELMKVWNAIQRCEDYEIEQKQSKLK